MKKPRPKTYMKYLALFVLGVSALAARDLKSGYFRGRPVTYEVINGDAVTEGDIVLGTAEEMAVSRPDAGTRAKTVSHEAIDVTTTTRRWPGGVIPYTVDSDVPDKKRITDGIQHWIDNTGLSLVPRTSEANYVRFSRFTGAGDVCGNSQVGMAGRGAQRINLADDCDSSTVIHEIGHAVGLFHEQTRQDRDFYVRVLYNNMDKTQVSQFDQQISAGQDLGSYDYGSVMHYSNFAFSRNGEATLESIPAGIPFRADTGLTAADSDAVKRMYNLPITGTTIASFPAGLLLIADGETFRAPKTFSWAPGSTHSVSVADPQFSSDKAYRYVFARWSDDGSAAHGIAATAERSVYTAAFRSQVKFPVSVSSANGGSVTTRPAPADGYFDLGSMVEITANARPGYNFAGWGGFLYPSTKGSNPARFALKRPDLRYVANLTTAATTTIASDLPGRAAVVDGQSVVLPQIFTWMAGSPHSVNIPEKKQLNFTETTQYLFRDWSDGGAAQHSVTAADKPQTINAGFDTQYLLTVSNPAGIGGTVVANPASPDNFYAEGARVSLVPIASGQYKFADWAGDVTGNEFPGSVLMDDQRLVMGRFLVPRSLSASSVVNAANYTTGEGVAPGEIVTIFGLDFGPAALTTLAINPVTRTAATTLSDTRVLFDGVAAPLIYVSPNQISAAVPYGVASKPSTRISIEYKGQLTNSIPVPVSLAEPALFTFDSSGRGPGALLNENSSVNTRDNPAAKGSVVVLYGTGEGLTNPVVLDGKPSAVPLAKPRLPVRVRIAGREAELLYAGAAPGLIAGVLQVNVRIPNDCPSGAVPVQLLVGERFSPQDVTIAVQ